MSPKTIIDVTKDKALETKEKVLETKEKVIAMAKDTVEETREKVEETIDKVEETLEKVEQSNLFKTLFRVNRNLTLAGLGAIALVGDQITGLGEKCLERGENVEQTARDIATDGIQRIRTLVSKSSKKSEEIVEVKAEEKTTIADKEIKEEVKSEEPKAEEKVDV